MRRFLGFALVAGFQLFLPALSASAETVAWDNLAALFRERYATRAPERVDASIAELEERVGPGFKLDPVVRASLERVDGEKRLATSVTQGSPYGTELSVRRSSSESGSSVGLAISQKLLKGGPFAGFPEDLTFELSYELAMSKIKRREDELLREAFAALAAAEAAAESLDAAKRSLTNAEDQNRAVKELVQSGYKPKADLIVAEQAQLRARQNVGDATADVAETRRKLALALFDAPESAAFALAPTLPLEAGRAVLSERLAPLAAVTWPAKTPRLREAEIEAELARTRATIASRDELPDLALSYGVERGQRDLGSKALPLGASGYGDYEQKTIGLAFSMPLVSGIRRDQAQLAGTQKTRAEAILAQTARETTASKMTLEDKKQLGLGALAAAERLAELATLSLGIEKQKYADGKATIADVRRVQEEEGTAVRTLLAARRDALLAHLDWALATGALGKTLK